MWGEEEKEPEEPEEPEEKRSEGRKEESASSQRGRGPAGLLLPGSGSDLPRWATHFVDTRWHYGPL